MGFGSEFGFKMQKYFFSERSQFQILVCIEFDEREKRREERDGLSDGGNVGEKYFYSSEVYFPP